MKFGILTDNYRSLLSSREVLTVELIKRLSDFQKELNQRNKNYADYDEYIEKLLVFENAGLFYLDFYGLPFEQSFQDYLELLSDVEVAAKVKSLTFFSPDRGLNGTRSWSFSPLLETEVEFPQLTTLFIEPGEPTQHNNPIVAKIYDEEGMLGTFLSKAPKLGSLTSPSATDSIFFSVDRRPLYYIRIESGYDHRNFILNLSHSSNLPDLRTLDFGDYNQRYMAEYTNDCTPFEHYKQLFESEVCATLKTFYLRNSQLTTDEAAILRAIRKDLSVYFIESNTRY